MQAPEKAQMAMSQAAALEKKQTQVESEDHHRRSKDTDRESNNNQTRNHTMGILYIVLNNILYIVSRLKYRS